MRLGWVAIGACALVACNAIVGFGDIEKVPASGSSDAGDKNPKLPKDASDPFAEAGTPRCDPDKPFAAPELMEELDPQADTHSAVMTDDELEVFYIKETEFRHGRRADRDAAWTIATEALNPIPDDAVSLSAAGLKMYYWLLDVNADSRPIRVTRAKLGDPFGIPENFLTPSSNPIFVVSSDDEHYYAARLDGGGDQVIHHGVLSSFGASEGKPLTSLHAGGNDGFPVLNRSQTVLYFTSTRPGGAGGIDVYTSRRSSRQDSFETSAAVAELNTAAADIVTWASDDDCQVLLDRASHIYRARRPL